MRFIGINEMYGFFSYSEEELRKPKEAYDCSAIIESMTDKDSWNKIVDKILSMPCYLYGCNMENSAFEIIEKELEQYI